MAPGFPACASRLRLIAVVLAWLAWMLAGPAVAQAHPYSVPVIGAAPAPEAEPESESEAEPESESEPEPEPESQAGAEPDSEAEPTTEAEAEPGAEAEAEPGAEPEPGAEAEAETETEPGAEVDAEAGDQPAPGSELPDRGEEEQPSEVDLTDPLGPVEAALDELQAQGARVAHRQRETSALQGEILTAEVVTDETRFMRYVLERVAEDGYQILLEPIGRDTFALVALRARADQGRGVALIKVEKIETQGNFRRNEDAETVRKIVALPPGGVIPLTVGDRLRAIGYDLSFRALGDGEILVTVSPGRAIRRVRVRGHIPLSERDVRRVLSPSARPGALARGRCVDRRTLRKNRPASICAPDDLACRRWEHDELERLDRFLFDQGYLRGRAQLGMLCGREDDEADLVVFLDKGRAFRIKPMRVTGNLTTQDQRWIRRVFKPTVGPFGLIPKRITRSHIEDAKERVAAEYAEPRTGPGSGGRRQLELPYPGVRIETNYDTMTREDVPARGNKIPLEIDIQLGDGVRTGFLGNERIGDNRLRSQLQLFKRQEPATSNVAKREAAHLRNFYQSKGFLLAEVEGRFQDFGALKQLVFVIDEGPRVRIRKVDFARPENVPKAIMAEIRSEYRRKRAIKPRGRFADAQARSDLGALLTAFAERGYLCARAQIRVGFWKEALDEPDTSAVLTPLTGIDAAGEPTWLIEQLDAAGLAALGERRRAGLYVRVEVDPGPRVLTSGREKVRHLEVRIPASREVQNLPTVETGAWGAPRILRGGPLRRKGDERAGGIPLGLTLDRDAERAVIEKYRASGYPLGDAEIRWVYTDATGQKHEVAQAERLTDPAVGLCRDLADEPVATVDTEINVYEGRRGTFGETLVRGNFKTRDYVLRREVKWDEGDEYSRENVQRSRKGIEGIGIAESVQIIEQPNDCELTDDPDRTCTVHHVVSIVESKDRLMDLTWGFGGRTLDPLYGFVRPTFPNLWGTAWDLGLDGHFGFNPPALTDLICDGEDCYERSGGASLIRPRIFASPLTFEITGRIQRRVTPARGQIDSALGTIRLTWPITEHWRVYVGYLIQAANISKDLVKPTLGSDTGCGINGDLPCRPPNRAEAIVPDLTGALETGAVYSSVDNPFNPDDGFVATANAMLASPWLGGNDWWFKGDLTWQHFIPIPRTANRLNFRYYLQYGHAVPIRRFPGADTTSIPEVWRYFGGGTQDLGLRGIEPQTMLVDIEEITTAHGTTILRPTAQGGHIKALGTVALQVVSVPEFLGGKLAHSLFLDFGILTQRWRHVVFNRDFRRSVGINFIKWDIRIVTVSLGYAVLIPNAIWPGNVRPTDDPNGRIVFDVGATF